MSTATAIFASLFRWMNHSKTYKSKFRAKRRYLVDWSIQFRKFVGTLSGIFRKLNCAVTIFTRLLSLFSHRTGEIAADIISLSSSQSFSDLNQNSESKTQKWILH